MTPPFMKLVETAKGANGSPQSADLFDRVSLRMHRDLGQFQDLSGSITFPKLEGPVGPWMRHGRRDVLVWSLNNYLGLAAHPDVLAADRDAVSRHGLGAPMGSRMLSGNTDAHELLEDRLAEFVGQEAGYLLNFGYQGCVSLIDALTDRNDVIVYDSESHACIVDGIRLSLAKRMMFRHNDLAHLEARLRHAGRIAAKSGGGILIVTEGVFGMSGDVGALEGIVRLKEAFGARLLVDDAHGFGVMGPGGRGTAAHLGVENDVDVLFCTFAKAMGGFGAFVAADRRIVQYLRYNMRSQIYAKSLCGAMVDGGLKRLDMLQQAEDARRRLFDVASQLQNGLRLRGLNLGRTASPVTPVYLRGDPRTGVGLVMRLREEYGVFVSGVTYPVIEKGTVMLRIMPSALHTASDVEITLRALDSVLAEDAFAACLGGTAAETP